MPIRRNDERSSGPNLRETQFSTEEFEWPENLAELNEAEREALFLRYQHYRAGRLAPQDDVAATPSRVITQEEAERRRLELNEQRLRLQQEQQEAIVYARTRQGFSELEVEDLDFVDGVGYIDNNSNIRAEIMSNAKFLSPDKKEEVLHKQKLNKEKMQRDQEIAKLNSAQMDAENRFGDL